jgi:hypothetical protein
MRTPLFRTLTWTLAPFLLGCGDSTGPEEPDEQVIPCTEQIGSVDVTVSDGLTPTFSWSPACGVAMILIEEDASDMWGAGTDEDAWSDPAAANLITPPVSYGATPTGTTAIQDALPLVSGRNYEVVLWRILPPSSTATCQQRFENACLLAAHVFAR